MAKSLFGGGAILTGALLLSSLVFNAHPSDAENLASPDSAQTASHKKDADGVDLSGKALFNETASVATGDVSNAPPAESVVLKTGSSPVLSGKTLNGLNASAPVQSFTATAYSLGGRTASGAGVRRGFIAADARVLPLGSRVRIESGGYTGEYVVADRGSAVRGHLVDIWVPSTREAMRFGRRPVRLTVLSYGARPATRPTTRGRRH